MITIRKIRLDGLFVVRSGFGGVRVLKRIDAERMMTRCPQFGGVDRDE